MLKRATWAGLAGVVALGLFTHLIFDARRERREAQAEMEELRVAMTDLRRAVGAADRLDAIGALGGVTRTSRARAGERPSLGDADGIEDAMTGQPTGLAAPGEPGERDEQRGERSGRGEPTLHVDEVMRRAEVDLASESVDRAWAGETALSVERTLARIVPPGSSVYSIECRTTRCRLELRMRDEAAMESFQREAIYGAESLWNGPMMMRRDARPDGSFTMVAHLVRE